MHINSNNYPFKIIEFTVSLWVVVLFLELTTDTLYSAVLKSGTLDVTIGTSIELFSLGIFETPSFVASPPQIFPRSLEFSEVINDFCQYCSSERNMAQLKIKFKSYVLIAILHLFL